MNHLFRNFRRLSFHPWSARCSSTDPSPSSKPKRKNSYVSVAEQIYEQLQQGNKIFVQNYDRLSPGLLRRRSNVPTSWYCFSEATAQALFDAAKGHLSPEKTIIEMNPGLGLLTEKLLSLNPSRLYVFEYDVRFRDILSSSYADRPGLTVVPKQFLTIPQETFKQAVLGDSRLEKWLPEVERMDYKSDPTVQIIGATAGSKLFQHIVNCVCYQIGIINYGRPELFVATTPDVYVQLTYNRSLGFSSKKRRFSQLLLFSIICDIEILCEVDAKSFVPWYTGKSAKEPHGQLVFLRAVPKRDLHDTVPTHLLKPLWFFVNQAVLRSKSKVIPYFEKWVPGCGPLFISKGLSVFTEFHDLSPSELLDAFLAFVNLPDYEASPFASAVDSFVFKRAAEVMGDVIEESTDEIVKNDDQNSANVQSVKPQ